MAELLYECENDHVRCYASIRPEQIIVIGFAGLGAVGTTVPWGGGFLEKNGFSYVSLVAKAPHWYPDGTIDLPAVVLDALAGRECVTYGFSMGGHAAFKFAHDFRAVRAVAAAPQFSIDPAVTKDRRYSRYFGPGAGTHHRLERPSCAAMTAIVDPNFAIDMQHIAAIRRTNPVALIPCEGAGHGIGAVLNTPEIQKPLLRVLRGEPPAD